MGMWAATGGLPEQLEAAVAAERVAVPATGGVTDVAVLGVGAEALAGQLVGVLTTAQLAVPLAVLGDGELPAYVGAGSVVFALSWSGEAPGVLAAAQVAVARRARVVVVGRGGGPLAAWAARSGQAVLPVAPDLPCGRSALGALAVAVLMTLEELGLVAGVGRRVLQAAHGLAEQREELAGATGGGALAVARRIGRTFPVVHGSAGITAVAAARWKQQVNANAKTPAFWAAHPDLDHHEVAGWGQSGDVTRQVFTLVELRRPGEPPSTRRRFEQAAEALDEVVATVVPVWAQEGDEVAQFFELALMGDFVSLHLAAAEGVDPGPTPVVDEIERAAAG